VSKTNRVFPLEFRLKVVQRIKNGESVTKLHNELDIKRSILYRWRDIYRKEGAAGLARMVGRPAGVPTDPAVPERDGDVEESLREQVAALERKVGQQALQLDFFQRAFKRVKESSRANRNAGVTASTRKSGR
jgi:transposase